MAIAIARMLGYELTPNLTGRIALLTLRSWKRWHISRPVAARLLYIPSAATATAEPEGRSQPDADDVDRRCVARRVMELPPCGAG